MPLPRREIHGFLARQDLDGVFIPKILLLASTCQVEQIEIVSDSAGVMNQMPDRDRALILRNFRHIFTQVVIEREVSSLSKEHDACRRELF